MIHYTIPSTGWHSPGPVPTHLRRLEPAADAALLHSWFSEPRASFWGMQDHSQAQVEAVYDDMQRSGHALACMGEIAGDSAFVLECYDPTHDVLGRHYDRRPGDVGMHFFVGPSTRETPIPGFTRHVFRSLMQFIFDHLRAVRVVVEPDIRNTKVHALNAAMGFEVHGPLTLPHKTALLSSCTRMQFDRATANPAVISQGVGKARPSEAPYPLVPLTTED